MTEQQILLAAIGAIAVLTVAIGFALAFAIRMFSGQVAEVAPERVPATADSKPAPAKAGAKAAEPSEPAAPAEHAPTPQRRTAGLGLVIFAVAIVAAGVLAGLFLRLMPVDASAEADQIDLLWNSMLGIAVAIFLLVEGVLIYSAFRFRRKRGEEGDGQAIHGSSRLEVAWTIIPAIIVIWLGIYSYQILVQIQTPNPNAMLITVTGQQFQWTYHYGDTGVVSNDLYIPEDKPIRLKFGSVDVIHSFWVPAFRVKQDVMPDRDTFLNFTADAPGEFPVVCAELCGAGHAQMGLVSKVVVQTQAEFDAWMEEMAANVPDDPRIALFNVDYACAGCHTLDVAGAAGQIGPDLNRIGAEAGSRVPGLNAEQYLRQSLMEPNAHIAPECPTGPCPSGVMPQDFAVRMPPEDMDALISLLLEQQ